MAERGACSSQRQSHSGKIEYSSLRRPNRSRGWRERSEPPAKATTPPGKIDPAATWAAVLAKVPPRGFLRNVVDLLTPVGVEGRSFVLGYAPDQKSTIETTATTSNRRQLETLVQEISGQDLKLKLEAREGLTGGNVESNAGKEQYKDDPLIQEALEMFKGQIKT